MSEYNALQAIQTKYLGPTNNRGSRVKATAAAGSVTVSWDYALNQCDNHRAAAKALCDKLRWTANEQIGIRGALESGQLADGSYVHVFADRTQGA